MKIRKVDKTEAGSGEITMDYAEQTFKELLAFQGYGFCLGYDVPVYERRRGEIPIGQLHVGDFILTPGDSGGERWEEVLNILLQGRKDVFRIEFANGVSINATLDHPLLCADGMLRDTRQILELYSEKKECDVMFRGMAHSKIACVTYIGTLPVLDITISGRNHLFYANGCIVHNCKAHATSYSVYSAVQMWLQEHYFLEYMCALLCHIDRAKEKKGVGVLNERVEYCMKHGTVIYYPDISRSSDKWEIVGGGLLAPLKNIKGFSDREVNLIRDGRPYADLKDFLDRTKFNKNRFEALLFAHALDCFGSIPDLYEWYYNEYDRQDRKPKPKKKETVDLFDMFGGEPEQEEEPSSAPRIICPFTKQDIEDRCLDMNGFVIQDNIQIKYHEFYERGMAKVAEMKRNDAYNSQRSRIYGISEALEDEIEEDKYSNKWVLAKVLSVARGINGKFGKFDKMEIGDGYARTTIFGSIPSVFQKGRVIVFPVSISGSNKRMYVDQKKMESLDAVILEEP